MIAGIFYKEIGAYFHSLIGYLVIVIFLLVSGLVFWVFPQTSILDHGYTTLEQFFELAPYLFMFLIPAVTMRSLAGERAEGTLDWLRTKPVTDLDVVLGKFLGGFVVVLMALIPTLVYVYTLHSLALPTGNLDYGSLWGSYLGLLLLVIGFLSIGLTASAIAPNPVVALLLAVFGCYFFYEGPDSLAGMLNNGGNVLLLESFGMRMHYDALARGVMDSRDVIYFLSIGFLFLLLTHTVLVRARYSRRVLPDLFWKTLSLLAAVVVVNYAASVFHARADFTADRRYHLSEITQSTVAWLDEPLEIRVLLDGNLPPDFQRLRRATGDLLTDIQAEARRGMFRFSFAHPLDAGNQADREQQRQELAQKGLVPTNLRVRNPDGSEAQQLIYPVALVRTESREIAVPLIHGEIGDRPEEALNRSIENLEYAFTAAIRKLLAGRRPVIGFTEGQGELSDNELHDALHSLATNFQVGRIDLEQIDFEGLDHVDVLVVAKPTDAFSEAKKFKIDYFLMKGGSIIWALDQLDGSLDSLRARKGGVQRVVSRHLGLDDQLFTYGIRFNHDLLLDLNCNPIPLRTAAGAGTSLGGDLPTEGSGGLEWMPWPLHPVLIPVTEHPLVRNLDGLLGAYVGSLDTLALAGIRKEVLLHSSPFVRAVSAPVDISLSIAADLPAPETLRTDPLPVAALLEGVFPSAFRNRPLPAGLHIAPPQRAAQSKPARIIAIADGDFFKNQINPIDHSPYPLGWDRYTGHQFANRDFLLNVMDYLTDDVELIGLRSKQIELRLLDRPRIQSEKRYWQLLNVGAPILLLMATGGLHHIFRRRRHTA